MVSESSICVYNVRFRNTKPFKNHRSYQGTGLVISNATIEEVWETSALSDRKQEMMLDYIGGIFAPLWGSKLWKVIAQQWRAWTGSRQSSTYPVHEFYWKGSSLETCVWIILRWKVLPMVEISQCFLEHVSFFSCLIGARVKCLAFTLSYQPDCFIPAHQNDYTKKSWKA